LCIRADLGRWRRWSLRGADQWKLLEGLVVSLLLMAFLRLSFCSSSSEEKERKKKGTEKKTLAFDGKRI